MKRELEYSGDTLTKAERSERMSRIRNKDTKPEMVVRRLLHALGYRFRLHRSDLPGKPDIVFPSRRKVVFVHGCFWHRHEGCRNNRTPKSRLDFWVPKLDANRQRDLQNQAKLTQMGWRHLVVWECDLQNLESLAIKLQSFLDDEIT
jgi:DNA mismatch endonuclease, patch repair protein